MKEEHGERIRVTDEGRVAVTIGRGVRSLGFDVIFVSSDSTGNRGKLNASVLAEHELPESSLHDKSLALRGFVALTTKAGARVVCIVTISPEGSTRDLLARNLARALDEERKNIQGRSVWLPLMGTGRGGLSLENSLATTLEALRTRFFGAREIHLSLAPGAVEEQLRHLEETARSFLSTVSAGSAEKTGSSTRAFSSSIRAKSSTPGRDMTRDHVWIQGPDSQPRQVFPLTLPLFELIERGLRLRVLSKSHSDEFDLSFADMFLALFEGTDEWSQWAQKLAEKTRLDVASIRRERGLDTRGRAADVTRGSQQRPIRITRSVEKQFRSLEDWTRAPLDVVHLIASLVFDPSGHEQQLGNWGFDAAAWASALAEEAVRRNHPLAKRWIKLRNERFLSAANPDGPRDTAQPAQASNASFAATQGAPTANAAPEPEQTQQQAAGPPAQDPWSVADSGLRRAFTLAAALAQPNSTGAAIVGIRELFGALVEENQWGWTNLLAVVSPALADQSGQSSFDAIHRKLGLPAQPNRRDTGYGRPAWTPEIAALLAQALALRSTPESELGEGEVFLAFWKPGVHGEKAPIDPLLPTLELDGEDFLRRLAERVQALPSSRNQLNEIRRLRAAPLSWNRPHVDNDRVDGAIAQDRDLLDARKPALRFAKLLAAKKVHPPIALGLFGNWGSGKTFFMGLMRDRIAHLAKTGGHDYVGRVVQIEFNAWHYHDTNLWASLAMRIFDGLARELSGPKETEVEAKRKQLHQKIRSSEARRSAAEDRRKQAVERREKAVKELDRKQAERATLEKESVRLRVEAAWKVITASPVFAELHATARGLAEHFGIRAALTSAEDVQRLRRDIDETSGRALGLFTAVGQRFHDLERGARTTALLLLVAAGAVALGRGFEKVAEFLEVQLPAFSATVLQVAALVSTAAAWSGRRVKEIRGAIDRIAEVEAELARAEKTVFPIELEELQAEIDALDEEIHGASEELSAAEREIAEATDEIDRINRGGLVYDFLQERRTAATYLGQLGLISTVRQDLEKLDVLLEDFIEHGQVPIERIILYVDDLDRCHPDKVVEVLQAVHLLLAFDLFNVVVGVDARWLERSLWRQYVGSARRSQDGENPFSPQDYLEKIFQIPYVLAPMGELGFKRLMGGLIETRTEWVEKEKKRLAKEAKSKSRAEPAMTPPGENQEDGVGPPVESDEEFMGELAPAREGEAPPIHVGAAPALYFEDHEQEFIGLLYSFIDRPRLAKRFVNLYRLLRVRADDDGESALFAGSSLSREYRAALILLAILVGHPLVASRVFRAIEHSTKDDTWSGLLEGLGNGAFDAVVCSESERSEIAAVAQKLSKVGARMPQELDSYRRWAPRVACYSFAWNRAEPFAPARIRTPLRKS